jgi:hypothetical protein
MQSPRLLLALAALATLSFPVTAQSDAGCIVAGRLGDQQSWAPRFPGVQLLNADGKAVNSASKQALAGVRQARLSQPALLARCDGNAALVRADDEPAQAKSKVPAVSAGLVEVEAVAFPKLRTGGELVELKLRPVAAERVVMLTR